MGREKQSVEEGERERVREAEREADVTEKRERQKKYLDRRKKSR